MTPKQTQYLRKYQRHHPKVVETYLGDKRPGMLSISEATALLTSIEKHLGRKRPGSLRAKIAEAARENNLDAERTIVATRERVGVDLVFEENMNGTRRPLPINQQHERARTTVFEVIRSLEPMGEAPPPAPDGEPEAPQPKGAMTPDEFLRKHHAMRKECERRAQMGEPLDQRSMRPALYAAQAYKQGIPFEAILHASTLTWPQDVRDQFGIEKFDPTTIAPPEEFAGKIPANAHKSIGYMIRLLLARVPMYLVGPKGTGKTKLAEQLAGILGLEWGFTPFTSGASYTWVTGTYTIDGYKTRPFVEAYEKGGVYLCDEIDAGNSNMLLVLNAALSGDQWQNPVTGEMIRKHEDFHCIAAGNTLGLGANRAYTGRERLDAATLDRFESGRVEVGYDNRLETRLFKNIING